MIESIALDVAMLAVPESAEFGFRALVADNRMAFRRRVIDLIAEGQTRFVVDCREARYIDSSGLGELVSAARRASDAGGALVVLGPNEDLAFLFAQTKLDTIFRVCSAEEWVRDGWPS